MSMKLFAAIDIGSYEVEMKIFEIAPRKGIREIDCVCHRMELGKDAYRMGKISVEMVEELCEVLQDFVTIMSSYRVDAYRVCATSAVRETKNRTILLDYIKRHTGLDIEVLGNSAQRFMDYKSIASRENEFNTIIQKGTAIVDIGGGSVQISLFDKDRLVATQNMRIGNLRLRERMMNAGVSLKHYETILTEVVKNELLSYKKLYLKDRLIQNLIVVGDHIGDVVQKTVMSREEFMTFYEDVIYRSDEDVAERYEAPEDSISVLRPSLVIYRCFIEETDVENIWMPGLHLTDGMAYEYAQENKILKAGHDFDEDILAAARNAAKRYQCSKSHIRMCEELAVNIFDKTRKLHGLGMRERLLLRIAVILHGCGKFISLSSAGECAYHIIMSMDLIGLSKEEKEVIANVAKYNTVPFVDYEQIGANSLMTRDNYLVTAKLAAILRIVNSLDRSHKQKLKETKLTLRERELVINISSDDDLSLEKKEFAEKAAFFEEVFSVKPVIHQKRMI